MKCDECLGTNIELLGYGYTFTQYQCEDCSTIFNIYDDEEYEINEQIEE